MNIGFLLFDDITQLDLTAPYEVLAKLPDAMLHLIKQNMQPARSCSGLVLLPTATYETAPLLDTLLVPGGRGINKLLNDDRTLDFVRRQAQTARYITSVCTGSLLLGAAGLLKGRCASTHWASRNLLKEFGAQLVVSRVVMDGNIITGGGVTAGIDIALTLTSKLADVATAEAIQLELEYDPHPPFRSGSPEQADTDTVERVLEDMRPMLAERLEAVRQAGRRVHMSDLFEA